MQFLFPNFIDDPSQYAAAVAFWSELCENCLAEQQKANWKGPWLNTSFVDGTPFQDGNPIYSLFSPKERKAIRINQLRPSHAKPFITVWMDMFGADATSDGNYLQELVINCELSDTVIPIVKQ